MVLKFKKGLVLGVGAIALASLAGCGGGASIAYNIDFTEDTKGTTIKFWTPFGGGIQEWIDVICENFEAETGIHVETESKGGYAGLQKAISLAASRKAYPHVALAYPDHMATYVNQDIIVRLDYYLENDGDDNFTLNDFYKDYLTECQTVEYDAEGNAYTLGIPFNKSTEVMCYNKTFFDWASKKDRTIVVPKTWDEIYTVAPKIRAFMQPYFGKVVCKFVDEDHKEQLIAYDTISQIPEGTTVLFNMTKVTDETFFPFTYDSEANLFITSCRQWGGTYTELDKATGKGYVAFDSAEVRSALTELQKAYNNRYIAVSNTFGGTSKYNSAYFTNCQSVMTVGSSAGVKNSIAKDFEVGVSALPYKSADKKYVISQGTDAVLLDVGSNAERVAAWKFIKYLTKEADGLFAANTSYFPSGEYASKSEAYQQQVNESKDSTDADKKIWYDTNLVNDSHYLNDSEGWTKFTDPAFVGSSSVRERMNTAMSELFIDHKTPDELISTLKDDLKDYVR